MVDLSADFRLADVNKYAEWCVHAQWSGPVTACRASTSSRAWRRWRAGQSVVDELVVAACVCAVVDSSCVLGY